VDNAWPLYGPMAGGTRVTISGQSLSVSTVTAVYFGHHEGVIDKHRSEFQLCTSRIIPISVSSKYVLCNALAHES